MTSDVALDEVLSGADVARPALLIGGEWVQARSRAVFPTLNPADRSLLGYVADADAADVDAAVRAARTAFDQGPWRTMKPAGRGRLLARLADLVERDQAALARLETIDSGKPIAESTRSDLPKAIDCLRYFAGAADKIQGDTLPLGSDLVGMTVREPIGVIAQIVPWNYPLLLATWKLAPALAAGNTLVLKPAEDTSLTALRLGELIVEAGFPPGVVNIVTGHGETTGRALVAHRDIDKIAFTGSTAVGREIVMASAQGIKQLSLELGGKGPNVVFDDADLRAAVKGAVKGAFANQGQLCCAGSRLFLHKGVYREFLDLLVAEVAAIRQGDPLDPAVRMGPLVSEKQFLRVLAYVDSGRSEGARLVCGGEPGGGAGGGYFVRPTIFGDVDGAMRIAREEIFGPVLAVIPFSDEDELVREANNTVYGLSAGIWTRDLGRAHRVARAIKAGTVWVNCFNKTDPAMPFGGYKLSGYGREQGMQAALAYTQTKSIWLNLAR